MMNDLKNIYGPDFFAEWGVRNDRYIQAARAITDILYDALKPKSLVDIGCGCGVYSHYFLEKKVRVLSIDGVKPPPEESYPIPFEIQDLTVPFKNTWGTFDVALCLEVAEHIPEEFLSPFLQNVTQLSDTLIMSAAPPNQGGHHHVNEQPKRYWVQRLSEVGFHYNRKKTGRIIEETKKMKMPFMWMGEHISVYERIRKGDDLKRELPFSIKV